MPQLERSGGYEQFLAPEFQAIAAHHRALYATDCDRLEAVLRSAIVGDKEGFLAGIEVLHPGAEGRIVCAVLVSKLAYKISKGQQHPYRGAYGSDWSQDRELAPRFSAEDKELLWRRFEPLDRRLQTGEEYFVPGFQAGPMPYYFEAMPVGLELDEGVADW